MSERKVYSEEFKRDAIQLAEDRGNLSDAARSLGVAPRMLQRWRKQLKETPDRPFPGHGNPQDIELARLKRQVARLQEDNEILKKAVGIFSIRQS